jgi:hypothetical protein
MNDMGSDYKAEPDYSIFPVVNTQKSLKILKRNKRIERFSVSIHTFKIGGAEADLNGSFV